MEGSRQRSGRDAKSSHPGKNKSQKAIEAVRDWRSGVRRDRMWLGIIVLAALIARLIVVWELYRNNPGFFSPDVDSGWHWQWAKELAARQWTGDGVFYRAPLYPYLLGVWFSIFGESLVLVRIVQALLGAVSAGLVSLIGWRVFGRKVAVLAGMIWAFWGPMIYYETELLIPVLVIPLNLLAIWLAFGRYQKRSHGIWPWLGIGAIIGVSAIARPNILITGPVFLWIAWMASRPKSDRPLSAAKRLPALIALLIGMLLPILPVTVRNYVVGNEPVLIAYQGGVNLYIGNNPEADGLTMQMPEVLLDASVSWDKFVGMTDSIASSEAGRELSPAEVSSFWTGKALEYMRAHPGATLGSWLEKTYYMLNGFEAGDQTDLYDFTRYSRVLRVLIWSGPVFFPFGLIAPFGLVGLVWGWRRARDSRPLAAFAVIYSISVVLFLATARHRLPIIPILVIFAAAAFWWLADAWNKQRGAKLAIAGGAVVALGIVLNLGTVARILENPAFTLYQEALVHDRLGEYQEAAELYAQAIDMEPNFMAARRNLALALVRTGRCKLAEEIAFSYLRANQHDAETYNNLGLAYLCQGDTAKAMGTFRVAMRENPQLGQPHYNMGDIALARGDAANAAHSYGRAIAADSSYASAYNALGVLLARGGLPDSAIFILRRCTERNPMYANAWLNLGNVLVETERYPEAIESMNKALDLEPDLLAVRYNLAVAYVRTGAVADATEQLELLLRVNPGHQQAAQLLNTIRQAEQQSGGTN